MIFLIIKNKTMKTTILKHRFLYFFILLGLTISLNSCGSDDGEDEPILNLTGEYVGRTTETDTYIFDPSKDTSEEKTHGVRVWKDDLGYYIEREPNYHLLNGYVHIEYFIDGQNIPDYSKRKIILEYTIKNEVMKFFEQNTYYDENDVIFRVIEESGDLEKQ